MMRVRASMALTTLTLLFLLLAAGAWWYGTVGPVRGGATVAIPLVFGHAINVNIWLRDTPSPVFPDATGLSMRPSKRVVTVPGRLTATVWHQDSRNTTNRRVAVLKLPTWPLLLMAGGSALAAVWLWPRRGLRHSTSPAHGG